MSNDPLTPDQRVRLECLDRAIAGGVRHQPEYIIHKALLFEQFVLGPYDEELTVKQPIQPENIRVGDLVRAEFKADTEQAHEGRIKAVERHTVRAPGFYATKDLYDWFLLDRPKPEPSRKAMVAARFLAMPPSNIEAVANAIDEAWAKEGLTDD